MFNTIRLKAANHLAEKASVCIRKGDYKNIRKGLKYFKMSVRVIPVTACSYDEWTKIRGEIYDVVEQYM